jgi:uncharacterized protein YndB with AHSA1/START domain
VSAAQEGFDLELDHSFRATPERIFAALTEPRELVEWWGPFGFTTPEIELDLRVGGGFRLGMQPPDGEMFHLSGEFLEIEPPSSLAYTFRWEEPDPDDRETVVRLTVATVSADVTELSLRHRGFATEARRALHHGGWSDSFQRLAEHIDSRR